MLLKRHQNEPDQTSADFAERRSPLDVLDSTVSIKTALLNGAPTDRAVDKSHLSSSSRDVCRFGEPPVFTAAGSNSIWGPAPGGGENNPKCIRRQRVRGYATSENVNT